MTSLRDVPTGVEPGVAVDIQIGNAWRAMVVDKVSKTGIVHGHEIDITTGGRILVRGHASHLWVYPDQITGVREEATA